MYWSINYLEFMRSNWACNSPKSILIKENIYFKFVFYEKKIYDVLRWLHLNSCSLFSTASFLYTKVCPLREDVKKKIATLDPIRPGGAPPPHLRTSNRRGLLYFAIKKNYPWWALAMFDLSVYISRAPVRVRIIIYKPEDKVNIQNDERLQSRGVLLVVQRYEIEQILKIK